MIVVVVAVAVASVPLSCLLLTVCSTFRCFFFSSVFLFYIEVLSFEVRLNVGKMNQLWFVLHTR